MSLTDNQKHLVEGMLRNSKGMYFDGCHKIYIAMDETEKQSMIEIGYEHHEPDLEKIVKWYDESCGLRFINAVFTNSGNGGNDGFVSLIPQFDEEEEEEADGE